MRFYWLRKKTFVILLITFIVSLILYLIIKPNVYPYKFKLIDSKHLDTLEHKQFVAYYSDLDKDGKIEKLYFNYHNKLKFPFIVAHNYKNELINQFNFEGNFPLLFNVILYDITEDSVDDVIVFTIKNDSLFLNTVDIKNQKILLKNYFILNKPDSVKTIFWDLAIENFVFTDVNNDNKKEILFSVIAGYSDYPRAIIAFDFENNKVVKKIEFGLYVDQLLLNDINKDGKEEILVSNSSRDNMEFYYPYHDKTAWHFIIDKDFNIVSPKDSFGGFSSALHYGINNSKSYAFFSWVNKCKDCLDAVYEVQSDFSLKLLKNIKLNSRPTKVKTKNGYGWFVSNPKNAEIFILDSNFNIISNKKFDYNQDFSFNIVDDVDEDYSSEIAIFSANKLFLYDDNLRVIAKLTLENEADRINPQFFQYAKSNNKKIFFCKSLLHQFEYEFIKNPIYSSFDYIFWSSSILLYFVIGGIFQLLILITIYLNFFIHFFRKSNVGLLLLNSEGEIMYANPKIYEFFGFDEKNIRKKLAIEIFNNIEEIRDSFKKSFKSAEVVSDIFYYSSDKYQINGKLNITPYKFLLNKIIIGYLVEFENFTQAILQDRVKVWAKYVQKIAHDIKTPLSSVILGIENIRNYLNKKEQAQNNLNEDFELLLKQTKRIMNSTKSILQLSNLELINFQVVYIDKVIDDALEKFSNKFKSNNIDLVKNINSDGNPIWADPSQLIQVFQILLENAIDAISDNGQIKVTTSINKNSNTLITSISDNGCGIKPELKSKIFSPYLTTKYDGTGIGLYLAKMIVETHNGKIYFESELNKGSTFYVDLPLLNKEEVLSNV